MQKNMPAPEAEAAEDEQGNDNTGALSARQGGNMPGRYQPNS
jgi:hypothetical protein